MKALSMLMVVLLSIVCVSKQAAAVSKVGDQVFDFARKDVNGNLFRLGHYVTTSNLNQKSPKPVLLVFLLHNPTEGEYQLYEMLSRIQQNHSETLKVAVVLLTAGSKTVVAFDQKNVPVIVDKGNKIYQRYMGKGPIIGKPFPLYILIDQSGEIVVLVEGGVPSVHMLESWITRVLTPIQTQVRPAALQPITQQPLAAYQLDSLPKRVKGDQPQYPAEALTKEMKGHVTVRLTVDLKGKVSKLDVLKAEPSFPEFVESIRQAVMQWQYEPAMFKGKSVKSFVELTFTYENKIGTEKPTDKTN